ncbi:MAG: DUF3106 domain-containing protein [Undibacterium sp.]|nr:DUF3106 domain-containing protein [Undibacterium sp.]
MRFSLIKLSHFIAVTTMFSGLSLQVTASYAQTQALATNSPLNNSSKTAWTQLSSEQKIALAPLANEWGGMADIQKKKWLSIADKFAVMKPEEKQRLQDRISAWVKLSPEQRRAARENFSNTSNKSAQQKSAQWQQYQQLSEAEKSQLANEAQNKKTVTTIQPESKRQSTILAPIKKGPTPSNSSTSASQANNNIVK